MSEKEKTKAQGDQETHWNLRAENVKASSRVRKCPCPEGDKQNRIPVVRGPGTQTQAGLVDQTRRL